MAEERTARAIACSILHLAFVPEGATPADALRNTLDLAQHAEQWGYHRSWLTAHSNDASLVRVRPDWRPCSSPRV